MLTMVPITVRGIRPRRVAGRSRAAPRRAAAAAPRDGRARRPARPRRRSRPARTRHRPPSGPEAAESRGRRATGWAACRGRSVSRPVSCTTPNASREAATIARTARRPYGRRRIASMAQATTCAMAVEASQPEQDRHLRRDSVGRPAGRRPRAEHRPGLEQPGDVERRQQQRAEVVGRGLRTGNGQALSRHLALHA